MSKLDVIRRTMIKRIELNPYTIITYVRPTIDNGYGVQIPDLTQPPVETELGVVTLSRRRLPDPVITNARSPYDFNDVYYLLAAWNADWLKEDLVFEYYGNKFKTLFPENRIMFGGIAYKLCDLEQVTSKQFGD